jgi:hypothetical protein
MRAALFAILVALSLPAVADVTTTSDNGRHSATVHTETVKGRFRESDNEVLAAGFVTIRSGDRMYRNLYSVECGNHGGRIATFNSAGGVMKEEVWIARGGSLLDGFALDLCRDAVLKLAAAELAKLRK